MERWADDASAFNRRISLPARMLLFVGSMVRRMKTFGCAAFLYIACLDNMNGEWMSGSNERGKPFAESTACGSAGAFVHNQPSIDSAHGIGDECWL